MFEHLNGGQVARMLLQSQKHGTQPEFSVASLRAGLRACFASCEP
jgi:hypothetical protein